MRELSAENIEKLVQRCFPNAAGITTRTFCVDEGTADSTAKRIGYGKPVHVRFRDNGVPRSVVLHTLAGDDFGHDRRSDRAAEMLQAFDSFGSIPHHVQPIDVGFVRRADGEFHSVAEGGEFYLLTSYAEGQIYADDLRAVASRGAASARDRLRCDQLVDCLVEIHGDKGGRSAIYTRSIRDLVGHGDGIFGLIDDFASDVPAAPPERLRAIESRCQQWRWRLRGVEHRLSRIHGDVHPFNILFDNDNRLALLDASRGCRGDPADDVICLALNYVFFAIGHQGAWAGLGELWHRFWRGYIERTGDEAIFDVAPPFLAWRALVMADPNWYPAVSASSRDSLLGVVEQALERGRFEPSSVEVLFAT